MCKQRFINLQYFTYFIFSFKRRKKDKEKELYDGGTNGTLLATVIKLFIKNTISYIIYRPVYYIYTLHYIIHHLE